METVQKAASEGKAWPSALPMLKTHMERVKRSVVHATLASGEGEDAMKNATQQLDRAVAAALQGTLYTCSCAPGYGGDGCELKDCPRNCSGHGECMGKSGSCDCHPGWSSDDCGTRACVGDGKCSNKGKCIDGLCACDVGWAGADCSLSNICPRHCSGNGVCVNGECECAPKFTGDDCSWSSNCLNFCSGRGICKNDECVCNAAYTGMDCSQPRCPGDCSGHGDCIRGTCTCEVGWGGAGCSRRSTLPLRCTTERRQLGLKSSTKCTRGVPDDFEDTGAQVLRMKLSTEPAASKSLEHPLPAQTFTEG